MCLKLAVDQKVAKDTARTPMLAIGPALDAGDTLVVDENISTSYKVATLAFTRSAENRTDLTGEISFEEYECV